ncbi:MAG: asparaginase [Odoribacteraceae bacterium]|jgi:L-asparaginase|nr:asparaginase [Odoribacteraceae bacterium]
MDKSILIIYTGGTIGMINDPETGVLCPFNFEQISLEVPEIREFDFKIDYYTLPEIIDSSNLSPNLWVDLCHVILENYDKYHGFVILHGTDTMAYSASALSFMLDRLGKPVVFTGSQLPVGKIRTDGRENLITAIEIAAGENAPVVPEVCILFGDRLFRGNRATKINAESFDAFQSFNYPPLAEIGTRVHYNREAIRPLPSSSLPPVAFYNLDTRVAILKIFPGLGANVVEAIISVPGLRGIVLETYGTGNAPTREDFLEKIHDALARGIIIYNVTQCAGGSVEMGKYQTSRELLNAGIINGYDITTEAALCKMMHVLGRYTSAGEIRKQLNSNLRGEISLNE